MTVNRESVIMSCLYCIYLCPVLHNGTRLRGQWNICHHRLSVTSPKLHQYQMTYAYLCLEEDSHSFILHPNKQLRGLQFRALLRVTCWCTFTSLTVSEQAWEFVQCFSRFFGTQFKFAAFFFTRMSSLCLSVHLQWLSQAYKVYTCRWRHL